MTRFANADHRRVTKQAEADGWTWRWCGSGHIMFRHPLGLTYTTSAHPRNGAWMTVGRQLASMLKRARAAATPTSQPISERHVA